ncbi:hypothetical protein K461DRAFT_295987 [Myriangium duriaei CBS 260.36]|uniref:Uncharacterized protein n=1 Tax=Myriangium duriaei CBS 260.36 TaxID=1168546 RepID=A0A9P4IY35_9PEZI|nr:hypothetical protein K461DRAFT_295987 [Myriangium duriaei CBS 260.36]
MNTKSNFVDLACVLLLSSPFPRLQCQHIFEGFIRETSDEVTERVGTDRLHREHWHAVEMTIQYVTYPDPVLSRIPARYRHRRTPARVSRSWLTGPGGNVSDESDIELQPLTPAVAPGDSSGTSRGTLGATSRDHSQGIQSPPVLRLHRSLTDPDVSDDAWERIYDLNAAVEARVRPGWRVRMGVEISPEREEEGWWRVVRRHVGVVVGIMVASAVLGGFAAWLLYALRQ